MIETMKLDQQLGRSVVVAAFCAACITFFTSCDANNNHESVIISLRDQSGGASTMSDRGYLFVVVDTDVMSFSATRSLAEAAARSFGYSQVALVDLRAYHLLDDRVPHDLYVFGKNSALIGDLAHNAILVFPVGSPPEAAHDAKVGVVLGPETAHAAMNVAWRTWSQKLGVPCVIVDGAGEKDVERAIRTVERMLIEKDNALKRNNPVLHN